MKIKVNEPLVGVIPHNGKFYALTQNFGALELRDEDNTIFVFSQSGEILRTTAKNKLKLVGEMYRISDGTYAYYVRNKQKILTLATTLKDAAIEVGKLLIEEKYD